MKNFEVNFILQLQKDVEVANLDPCCLVAGGCCILSSVACRVCWRLSTLEVKRKTPIYRLQGQGLSWALSLGLYFSNYLLILNKENIIIFFIINYACQLLSYQNLILFKFNFMGPPQLILHVVINNLPMNFCLLQMPSSRVGHLHEHGVL